MVLHPILKEKLNVALEPFLMPDWVRRDASLPGIDGKIHAVIGMRRAGKTVFLRQLQAERRKEVPPERALYLSLEDDRLAGIRADQLDALLEEYYRRFPSSRGSEVLSLYLDEVQTVPGWEQFVRRIQDTERVEVVVSGSSAKMLSHEVHTALRGRGMATVIRPFSFREYLRFRGEEPEAPSGSWGPKQRSLMEQRFMQYIEEGGFPEVQGKDSSLRRELLQGYVDTVLFRDIVERYDIKQVAALRWVVRHCLRNPAGRMSVHRLFLDLRAQGLPITKDAVYAMLDHLTDAFLLSTVSLWTDSERRRNSNPRKVYPSDVGLIGAYDVSGRKNLGHALESIVAQELERRASEVGYVSSSDGTEVDFAAHLSSGDRELIQVCADISVQGTVDRELRALRSAQQASVAPMGQRLLLLTHEQSRALVADGVIVQPVYEWLLEAHEGTRNL